MDKLTPEQRAEWHQLASRCAMLHHDLMKWGLYATGKAMHEVVKKIGWEMAERFEKEGK